MNRSPVTTTRLMSSNAVTVALRGRPSRAPVESGQVSDHVPGAAYRKNQGVTAGSRGGNRDPAGCDQSNETGLLALVQD